MNSDQRMNFCLHLDSCLPFVWTQGEGEGLCSLASNLLCWTSNFAGVVQTVSSEREPQEKRVNPYCCCSEISSALGDYAT